MAMAHVQKTPVPPSRRSEVPVPQQLEEIILRCLAKQPEQRPQSARELNRLLASVRGVPEWTQEDASEWWRTYLPASSSYRMARQPRATAADGSKQNSQPGAHSVAR
jgi:serine/threonine-protein kinase